MLYIEHCANSRAVTIFIRGGMVTLGCICSVDTCSSICLIINSVRIGKRKMLGFDYVKLLSSK